MLDRARLTGGLEHLFRAGLQLGLVQHAYEPSQLKNSPPDPLQPDLQSRWAEWEANIREQEAEQRRQLPYPTLFPVLLQPTSNLTAVFGGTARGLDGLLTFLGASMLATHRTVTLSNLTRYRIGARLHDAARFAGVLPIVELLNAQHPRAMLYDCDSWAELSEVVRKTLSASAAPEHRIRELNLRNALDRVTTALSAPASLERLVAALDALFLDEFDDVSAGVLREDETRRLLKEFGPELRRTTDIMEDIRAVRSAVDALAPWLGSRHRQVSVAAHADPGLRFVGVAPESADFEHLREMLVLASFRWAQRALTAADRRETLVIIGANEVPLEKIKQLAALTYGSTGHLVLLFEHVDEETIAAVGVNAELAFMRLTSSDTELAAEHIGRIHQFVLTQRGANLTNTNSKSQGTNASRSHGKTRQSNIGMGAGVGFGGSETDTEGWNQEDSNQIAAGTSVTFAREHELIVQERTLQFLDDFDIILPREEVLLATCDPALVRSGKPISRTPYEPWLAAEPARWRR